ncbi:hypothetical protein F2Q70_00027624 [Brassica cretica]|uniref:Reverse transcriptase zinc-binding domain-containing protein n=1 Tax=Brassica cretica TaxID=69181 RepID=A0A8S9L7W8_BRACR|nr:hypothetical protein F2Q70_00027624 [Brassica cretica]
MPELASRILTLRPSLLDTPDSFMWHLQKSGSYSAKSGFFMWNVLHNSISTGENLQKRGMLTNTLCLRCGAPETHEHMFFHCSFAQEVWSLRPWTSIFTPTP